MITHGNRLIILFYSCHLYSDVHDDHTNEVMVEDFSLRQQKRCKFLLNFVLRLHDWRRRNKARPL